MRDGHRAKRANLEGAAGVGFDIDLPVFSVGKVGQIAEIHPQTLRQYDRQGLVVPGRTEGGSRRYCLRDVDRLVQAQHLSQDEGINLNGVMRILELEEENRQLRHEVQELTGVTGFSVFTADMNGSITQTSRSHRARYLAWAAPCRGARIAGGGELKRAVEIDGVVAYGQALTAILGADVFSSGRFLRYAPSYAGPDEEICE